MCVRMNPGQLCLGGLKFSFQDNFILTLDWKNVFKTKLVSYWNLFQDDSGLGVSDFSISSRGCLTASTTSAPGGLEETSVNSSHHQVASTLANCTTNEIVDTIDAIHEEEENQCKQEQEQLLEDKREAEEQHSNHSSLEEDNISGGEIVR